ncbi:MAG: hypothetical protein RDU14_01910 [Melioribacteraceae bacterium]|nr:hypothetical protein [Melioribacteraceae bacterium]
MWLILKTICTIFIFIILSSQTVNGQREESSESKKKKEMESVRTKANSWKGEKVILLPSVISQALWCSEDLKKDELYHQIYIQGTGTGRLPAAKYAGKTGIIIDINIGEYVSEYKQPEVIILLDDLKEKIVAPVDRIGFFKELDLARMLIGRTLQIKGNVSLGIASEYCQDPKLRPRFKLHEMESVTVTRVEWGTDLQHIHLFIKIGSGEELVFDGYDGYDYFDEKFNMPHNLSGNYSRRFHVDMTFAEEYKTKMLRETGQTFQDDPDLVQPLSFSFTGNFAKDGFNCNGEIKLSKVEGGYMCGGEVEFRNGNPLIWCSGNTHIWEGTSYSVENFFKSVESDKDSPLTFFIHSDSGYVYRSGKGKIILPSGKEYIFPPIPPIDTTIGSKLDIAGLWEGQGEIKGVKYNIKFSVKKNKKFMDSLVINYDCKKGKGGLTSTMKLPISIACTDSFYFSTGATGSKGNGKFISESQAEGSFEEPLNLICDKKSYQLIGFWKAKKIELKVQSGFKIELISTKLVNRVNAAFGGDWHSTDTTQTKGLIMKVKMFKTPSMKPLKTLNLFFEYEDKGAKIKTPCLGCLFCQKKKKMDIGF